ncbi:hypothetical protein [Nonomuraea sp. NEAU-A123]|uniref:hypothetical protein n=1 Tax=Nonomuraea sp. NEAU-A123 TaxID=2839649 RepID=UPI001BE4408C|nr:hypothetical protein [Nonomuraea sp. NEAU-A123]MBT2231080.1 hypothetical protein [Nonomuraea sp. NEAU-A123]
MWPARVGETPAAVAFGGPAGPCRVLSAQTWSMARMDVEVVTSIEGDTQAND